jgi:hypothetical protein
MAEHIAKWLLEMEPDNAAGYVLLLNIYAAAGNRHLCENVEQLVLGPLYTRSQGGQKNLGPTLSIFGLQLGPKILINARTAVCGSQGNQHSS